VPAEDPVPADPALDPEIARAAARVAPRRGTYQSLGLLGLGWAIAICLVGGLLGGLWLDSRFGTSPLLTGLGTIVGLALAYLVFREMLRQSRA
jgi:F0F1-type ATP synthase assembly protein I